MRCASCGFDNEETAKFCIECGRPLQNRCPGCGVDNLPHAKFCKECGTPLAGQSSVQRLASRDQKASGSGPRTADARIQTLDPRPISYTPKHLAERILAEQTAMAARSAPEGERKTITALFADIKGSMELIEDLDPEDARRLFDPALQLMMEAVHRYEGYVVQSTGDGIFAFFGAPIACEDHPQRALYAALKMQEDSKQYAEQLRLERGLNLQIRVGVNTGEVVLRSIRKDDLRTEYTPIGHSTSLAARMESLATPGSVLVSEDTQKLTEGYFSFKSLGAARVKGVSDPVPIYEVLGVGPLRTRLQVAARRGLVRFVGRQSELEQMKRALESARGGHGQIVGVMGEPGVGKSRLFHEFKLSAQRGCLVLETFSVSHGKAYAYLPLIELLKHYFQLTPQDDERRIREKVAGKVLILDRSLEDTLPHLFTLLALSEPTSALPQMDPQLRRRRTLEAIKRLLVRESLNQPLMLIFEDLHWLDTETQAFLSVLSESLATTPILLLVNYRPEYRHEWGNKTYYTQLRLDPLGPADAQELLTALLGDAAALRPLKQFILEKTEGNPFFIEEIVQALVEQGIVVRDAVGAHGHTPLPADLHLPTTVQGVLAARIDRLLPAEKPLLQTLAVIGKEFSLSLLRRVVDKPEDELHPLLSHLQTAEFIYEQPAFPEPEYIFKHALTQEVAYNSLLLERRRALHERTAQAIEDLFHSRLDNYYGDLAHHYTRSTNTQKAVEYLHLAGQQAAQRSANSEAINHFTVALELLMTLPDTSARAQKELALQFALGTPLMATRGYAALEVEKTYSRARELCQQVGETSSLFPALWGLWMFHMVRGELQTARLLGEQLLDLASHEQDPALFLEAHRALGAALLNIGEFVPARDHLEQAFALYDFQRHRALVFRYGQDLGVSCQIQLARALWYLGYPDQALKKIHESLTLARELAHPFTLALALNFAAWVHHLRREVQAVRDAAEATMTLSMEQGFPLFSALGAFFQGWALAEQGQVKAGIAQARQGVMTLRTGEAGVGQSYHLALLAEMFGRVGRTEEGLATLAEALSLVDKNGEHSYEAEIYRLKGQLLLNAEHRMPNAELVHYSSLSVRRSVEAEECFVSRKPSTLPVANRRSH